MSRPFPPSDLRTPVTLLTGFLGAGKATILNTILRAEDGPKVAVIVNEIGESGLDHDLVTAIDKEVVLMQSGCLCCSMRGDAAYRAITPIQPYFSQHQLAPRFCCAVHVGRRNLHQACCIARHLLKERMRRGWFSCLIRPWTGTALHER